MVTAPSSAAGAAGELRRRTAVPASRPGAHQAAGAVSAGAVSAGAGGDGSTAPGPPGSGSFGGGSATVGAFLRSWRDRAVPCSNWPGDSATHGTGRASGDRCEVDQY